MPQTPFADPLFAPEFEAWRRSRRQRGEVSTSGQISAGATYTRQLTGQIQHSPLGQLVEARQLDATKDLPGDIEPGSALEQALRRLTEKLG